MPFCRGSWPSHRTQCGLKTRGDGTRKCACFALWTGGPGVLFSTGGGNFSQFYWDIKSSWCTLQISYRYLTVLSDPWVLIKPLLPQTTNTWAPGTWQLCHALHTHTCIFEEVSGGCTQWLTALILLMLFAGLMTAMAGNHTGVTLSPGKWGHWAGQPPLNTLPSTPSLPAAAWYPIGVVGVLSGRLCCSSGALHFK